MSKVRTTIMLPEEDARQIKLLAAQTGMTMSEIIVKSVRKVGNLVSQDSQKLKNVGWRSVAGALKLGDKKPPRREELYERYIKEKNSR